MLCVIYSSMRKTQDLCMNLQIESEIVLMLQSVRISIFSMFIDVLDKNLSHCPMSHVPLRWFIIWEKREIVIEYKYI